ncbi:MAG: hypothetical protein QM784_23085 [Polyangiaceae bacterium]
MKRSVRAVLASALLCALFLGQMHICQARSRPRVIVVTTHSESTTALRLEAELRSMDVEVIRVTSSDDGTHIRQSLQRLAKEQGAFAAVRIVPTGDEAEVWVADRVTGKTLVREVISGGNVEGFDEAISLGAVELLRASLLEVATVEDLKGDVEPEATPTKLLPKPTQQKRDGAASRQGSRLLGDNRDGAQPPVVAWLGIEPGVVFGVGRLKAGATLELDLKVLGRAGLGGQLFASLPLSGQSVEVREDKALLRAQQIALMGCYAPTVGALNPSMSAGLQTTSVTSTGETSPPNYAQEQRRVRIAPVARLGVAYRFMPSLGLRLDGTASYQTEPLAIRMLGREVAEFGRPTISVALGIELGIPLTTTAPPAGS